jgi:dTDP-4-amino-4,6-dideoxygalactose transaminase
LDEWNARRSKIAEIYLHQLSDLNAQLFSVSGFQLLPTVPSWASPVWHLFVIRHPQRDALQQKLTEAGIGTLIHYPVPPHLSGAYARPVKSAPILHRADLRPLQPVEREATPLGRSPVVSGQWSLPIAEELASTVLSLPIGPHLNAEQAGDVIAGFKSALAGL